MRKAIAMLMILTFGASLWADQNVQKLKSENQRPKIMPEKRHSTSIATRTESYSLYMEDSFGDGWGGSSLDLADNGVAVASGLTITTADNGGDWNDLTLKLETLLPPHGHQCLVGTLRPPMAFSTQQEIWLQKQELERSHFLRFPLPWHPQQ